MYAGNGSTSLPYPITFKFLRDASNVKVQITPPSGPAFLLTAGQYTVHDEAGANPTVTTTAAWTPDYGVTIFRWLPFTQPYTFPNGSALSTLSIEDALDRAVMLAMQTGDMGLDNPAVPGLTTHALTLVSLTDSNATLSDGVNTFTVAAVQVATVSPVPGALTLVSVADGNATLTNGLQTFSVPVGTAS